MHNPEQIAQNIEEILKTNKISARKFFEESGIKRNTLANMKSGSMPSADKIAIIAEKLGVSMDYLLGVSGDKKSTPSATRSAIVKRVESLSDRQAELLLAYLEGLQAESAQDVPDVE